MKINLIKTLNQVCFYTNDKNKVKKLVLSKVEIISPLVGDHPEVHYFFMKKKSHDNATRNIFLASMLRNDFYLVLNGKQCGELVFDTEEEAKKSICDSVMNSLVD